MDPMLTLFVISSAALFSTVFGNEDDATKLDRITNDFWEWRMEDIPEVSTTLGYSRYNDRLEDKSWEMFEKRKDAVQAFLNRLHEIDRCKLQHAAKINYDILKATLKTFIDGYEWRFFGSLNPMNFLEGIYTDPSSFVEVQQLNTWGDFINYLSRLEKMPTQLKQMIGRQRKAMQLGHVYHNVSVTRIPDAIDLLMEADPTHSIFYKPFNDTLERLASIPQNHKNTLRQRADNSIRTLISAFGDMKTFITDEYMPHTRTPYGVENWEVNRKKNYAACLRWHLSLDMTPEEVHQKGLEEVDRISQEMKKIMDRLGKKGTIKEFFDELKKDPKNQRHSGEELLDMYRELINRTLAKIPQMFNNYPNLPIRVIAMTTDGPGGMYGAVSEDGSRPGTFYANVLRPEETPVFDMPALTLHEAIPGHHLQTSYAVTAGLSKLGKNTAYGEYFAVPFTFPFYTAYDEGWALYAESLGEEMGIYRDDIELMGRYGSEIFRACRLVVDTGLHHYGWDRERAIEYMLNYTAYSRQSTEVEVDRYLTWPGQACGYKIGELKIKELRKRATEELGDLFDIKDFHSAVVGSGSLPLMVLEDVVNTWINTTKAKENQKTDTNNASYHSIVVFEIFISVTLGKYISGLV